MRADVEKRLAKATEVGSSWLAGGAAILFSLFLLALVTRGLDYLIGSKYPFQSVGDFLRLPGPQKGLLAWDRSSLLMFAAALLGFGSEGLDDMAAWLRKSPEQRQQERERARAQQATNREVARAQKQQKKAARRPMSGWRRLWIVLSILLGAVTYLIEYDAYSRASAFIEYQGNNEDFWRLAHRTRALGNCDWATAKADTEYPNSHGYVVSCTNADPWLFASLWALLPAALMAAIGLTVRWIYRGFRPRQA